MTLAPEPPPSEVVYVRVTRVPSTRVDERGVLLPGAPHRDRWDLVVPEGPVVTSMRGLTVATWTDRPDGAPVWQPGWYADALTAALHRGDPALTFEGFTAPAYVRSGTGERRQDWDAHLLVHDLEGPGRAGSWGCPTAPQPWLDATIAYLDRLWQDGVWKPRMRRDGRWTVGVWLREAA